MLHLSFKNLIARVVADGRVNSIELPENWLQGRTAYGGLSGALIIAAIQQDYPDAPPLRSAQITFVGPLNGTIDFSHTLLRQGKNAMIIEGQISSAEGIGLKGIFIFSNERPLTRGLEGHIYPDLKKPEECETVLRSDGRSDGREDGVPHFLKNFDCALAGGTPPFSNDSAAYPSFALWFRHQDPASHEGLIPLIAIADAPPPAMMARYPTRIPLSSMNWQMNFHTSELITTKGWWLVECASDFAQDGYTSQTMRIYNYDGKQVCDATQYIAVFEPKT